MYNLFCSELAHVAVKVAECYKVPTGSEHGASQSIDGDVGELRDHRGSQRFVSPKWSTHLAEALPWRTRRAYRFKRPNHITIF